MRGLTLAELLIVVSIIALIAGISIPVFRNLQPTSQLSGTVRSLVSDIRLAQQLAVTEQVEHGIRFATTTQEYQIIRFGAIEEILQGKQLPREVSFSEITGLSGEDAIFNPYGAAKEAGTITLINTQSATTIIDIRPSGFVRIIK